MSRARLSRRDFGRRLGAQLTAAMPLVGCLTGCLNAGRSNLKAQNRVEIADPDGTLQRVHSPVYATLPLPDALRRAGAEGRLVARELTAGADGTLRTPVQLLRAPADGQTSLCWLLPPGSAGLREFCFEAAANPATSMFATEVGRHYALAERAKPILMYNYALVEPGDRLKQIAEANLKYAVARSDYIHPLYGPSGEVLTKDWPIDHPHHRGIYWAWPEVDWRGQRGDLHALQKVFARPTGRCQAVSGPVFAEISAENSWLWQDREPIIREHAHIRAYAAGASGRYLDLRFRFEATGDPVSIARRDATHYGGLNIRLNAVKDQRILKYTGTPESTPRAAWSDLSGTFPGADSPAGVTVLQHQSNPDYPGDWIEYPELNWVQPAFPASGTRYTLQKGRPLELRFRIWIHNGPGIEEPLGNALWCAANARLSPLGS